MKRYNNEYSTAAWAAANHIEDHPDWGYFGGASKNGPTFDTLKWKKSIEDSDQHGSSYSAVREVWWPVVRDRYTREPLDRDSQHLFASLLEELLRARKGIS